MLGVLATVVLRLRYFLVFFLSAIPSVGGAQTLEALYEKALANNAAILTARFEEGVAREQKSQAIGNFRPTIAINNNATFRDPADVGPFGEAFQNFAFINLTQPLFQGGSEYYAISVAKKLPEIARYNREQEELNLYLNLAQAFYQALRLEALNSVLLEQKKTLTERVSTLSQRVKIGRSKVTDLIAARSTLARITAESSQAEQQLVAARNLIKNISGSEKIDTLFAGASPAQLQLSPNWQQNLMATPRVQASNLLVENASKEVKAARGTFLPSVNLDGNYFLERAGILRNSEWEVNVNARWEIISGGRDLAEIRLRSYQLSQLKSQNEELRRNINNDFESLKKEFQIHQRSLLELKSAVDLAKENYQRHLKEANQGLVSDLDALQVLQDYLLIRQNYDQQVFNTRLAWVQLRALSGEHP